MKRKNFILEKYKNKNIVWKKMKKNHIREIQEQEYSMEKNENNEKKNFLLEKYKNKTIVWK